MGSEAVKGGLATGDMKTTEFFLTDCKDDSQDILLYIFYVYTCKTEKFHLKKFLKNCYSYFLGTFYH